MSDSRNIDVEIFDRHYAIVLTSPIQEAEVRKLADDVDERMRRIAAAVSTVDSLKIAVLAALHLAQELRELQQNAEKTDALLRQKTDEWTLALEKVLHP